MDSLNTSIGDLKKNEAFTFFNQPSIHLYNASRDSASPDAPHIKSEEIQDATKKKPCIISVSNCYLSVLDPREPRSLAPGGTEEIKDSKKETRLLHLYYQVDLQFIKKIVFKKSDKERIKIGVQEDPKEDIYYLEYILRDAEDFLSVLQAYIKARKDSLKAKT